MKKGNVLSALALLIGILIVWGCEKEKFNSDDPSVLNAMRIQEDSLSQYASINFIPNEYIVVMKEEFGEQEEVIGEQNRMEMLRNYKRKLISDETILKKHFERYDIDWQTLKGILSVGQYGFCVELNPNQLELIYKDPMVESVIRNFTFEERQDQFEVARIPSDRSQVVNWGVQYVGSSDGTNLSRKVFIIDTGVDLDHEDLNVDSILSRNVLHPSAPADDQNGHGTMIAGIIGAKDNSIGIKGVASGASVVSVKTSYCSWCGKGNYNIFGSLLGLDYTYYVSNPGDVANCSFGWPNFWFLRWTKKKFKRLADKGVHTVVAAGQVFLSPFTIKINVKKIIPAGINRNNLYTISAMRMDQSIAPWSFYGKGIDFAAPGQNIESTLPGDMYGQGDGTSYATAHVSAILLLNNGVINTNGFVTGDTDGYIDPIAVL